MTSHLPPRSVVLHVGVHKTATTHLQRSFVMQKDALSAAGVQFYGPETLRRDARDLGNMFDLDVYDTPRRPRFDRVEQARRMFKQGHRLILSDENFIGVLHDRMGNMVPPIYPKAAERVSALSTAIGEGPIDVALAIRNPASFLKSAYCQALLGGKSLTFSNYLARNPMDQIYWSGLVARLRAADGVGRVIVWRFEDYRALYPQICGLLTGTHADIRIAPLNERINSGLSEAAVAAILAHADDSDPKTVAEQARDQYPVGVTFPAFDPFSGEDKAAASAEYALQLEEISKIKGVTFLRP